MAVIVIENPSDKAVNVRVIGKSGILGLQRVDKRVHVSSSGSASVGMSKGKYFIRYQHEGSCVWEGDAFRLEENAGARIVLQLMSGGNYHVRPLSEEL